MPCLRVRSALSAVGNGKHDLEALLARAFIARLQMQEHAAAVGAVLAAGHRHERGDVGILLHARGHGFLRGKQLRVAYALARFGGDLHLIGVFAW